MRKPCSCPKTGQEQGFCGAGLLAVLTVALTAPAMVSPLTYRVAGAVADTVAIDVSVGLGAAILAALANWIAANITDAVTIGIAVAAAISAFILAGGPDISRIFCRGFAILSGGGNTVSVTVTVSSMNGTAGNIADTIAVCVTDHCGILGIVFLHKPSAVSSGQGRGTGKQCCSDNESSHDFFVHFHFKHSLFLDLGFIIEEIYGKIVTEVKK